MVIEIEGQTQDFDKLNVDVSVNVGDAVVLVDGVWRTNISETEQREQKIKKLIDDVWED
ncbi:DUF3006 domain-containing protein [Paenibacillus crassostreae]|uniref:DUF3006 domain-containing protein n=1 Tax=Paenibacillus crassostreae TaxID=1763538 RepID=UPI000AED9974|nr:DUF3006 domain-containing protein [Paenibacillus crassostreae]